MLVDSLVSLECGSPACVVEVYGGGGGGYGREGEGVLRDWFPFSLSEFGAHAQLLTVCVWMSDLEPAIYVRVWLRPPERMWLSSGLYVAVF